MNGSLAKQYLTQYKTQSDLFFQVYLENSIKEAKEFGSVTSNAIQQFTHIASKGKRIRGALVILGYELAGGSNPKSMIKPSLAMELFHAALLVHDDIMDNASTRRGIKTVHTSIQKYFTGQDTSHNAQSVAICVGDAAFYFAWDQLMNSERDDTSIMKAMEIFIHYAKRVTYGQINDIVLSQEKKATEKQILDMMYLKSGEYTCEMPLMFGVELAGGIKINQKRALLQYAKALGWLFQIQDDILGIFGDEKITGKSNTSDLSEGKMTLLHLYLDKLGNTKQKAMQSRLMNKGNITTEELKLYQKALVESKSLEKVKTLAKSYLQQAQKEIPSITTKKQHQLLLTSLLHFMIERIN